MAKQVINVGNAAQDGNGDPLRDAMIKINANFTELYDGIVVQTIVGENGTTLVDISANSVNANALTGTVPTGVATWDNLGGKPTSVATSGILDLYNIAQTDAQIASEIDDLKVELGSGGAGAIDASVLTGSLPAIDGSALTGITAGVASSLNGDMTGSVFADDSTLLVDGVSGTIPGSVIDGQISVPSISGVGGGSTNTLDLYADLVGQVSKDGQKRIFATDTINDVFEIGTTAPYSEYQPTLKVYGNAQFGSITLTGGSALTGDITGSVFGDDSTVLVDGVNGTINSSALTKPIALADNEKIIFGDDDNLEIFHNSSNGNTIIDNNTGNLVIKGSNLFLQSATGEDFFRGAANGAVTLYYDDVAKFNTSAAGIQIEQGVEEKFATLTGATGTVTHDCDNGHIFYHTTPAADWTANFTNLDLTAEYATTLSIVIDQGATAYIPSAVQIGGVAQTLLWQGGSAPSGTADGTDVVAFSILNDGGTYVVMGQLVGFS
jgi:hypothetical protein